MTGHAKGPWTVEHDYKPFDICDADGNMIASISGTAAVRPNAEANAALIETAPEMLAALKDMVLAAQHRWRPLPTDSFEKRSLNAACAIISKAEGK